jgi:alanine racemase
LGQNFRKTVAEVNLAHLRHNWKVIMDLSGDPQRFVCPMIKANAYGHGDVRVALELEKIGAKRLGVCLIEEALILRNAGVQIDILVFRGFDLEGAREIARQRLTPVVSTWEQLEYLDQLANSVESWKVHIKFDTGMNRLGFDIREAKAISEWLQQREKFQVEGVLTHLFQSEDSVDLEGMTRYQIEKFETCLDFFTSWKPHVHVLNSGAIAGLSAVAIANSNHPLRKKFWGFRPGLILYGYQPIPHLHRLHLKPVMSLKSCVGNIRTVQQGESVSYSGTWRATRKSMIGIVPIGYADGVHRILSNQSRVLINGKEANIVGNICMDYLMIDLTDVAELLSFEELFHAEVVIYGLSNFGTFLSPEWIARSSQTITWEVLTSVGERVPRVYVGDM